jgi:hypothetical protein
MQMSFIKKSKKEQLLDWIREKKVVKTSDVIQWGVFNYCNRAMRNAQQLAQDGLIERLDKHDKYTMFGNIKEDVWRIK